MNKFIVQQEGCCEVLLMNLNGPIKLLRTEKKVKRSIIYDDESDKSSPQLKLIEFR